MKTWTYSALDGYETCPRKYYHTRVRRDFSDVHDANAWGVRAHKAFELRMRNGTPLPEGMTQWEGIATKLLALPGEKLFETKLSVDAGFASCHWGSAWSRGVVDMLVVNGREAAVLDYKTGKYRPSEQLKLYAAYVFATYPVDVVKTGYVWLKERRITKDEFARDAAPTIWREFLPRVNKLENAYKQDRWPAKPSGLCKGWCPVRTCEHNETRDNDDA